METTNTPDESSLAWPETLLDWAPLPQALVRLQPGRSTGSIPGSSRLCSSTFTTYNANSALSLERLKKDGQFGVNRTVVSVDAGRSGDRGAM
jgi:hypothetical protein